MAQRGHVRRRGETHTAYWWTIGPDGGRKQASKGGFMTSDDAWDFVHERLADIRRGTYVDPSRETMGAYLRRWIEGRRDHLRPSTFESYHGLIEHYIVPKIGGVRIQALRPAHLSGMYAALRENGAKRGGGLSRRTVRYCHVVIGRALRDAERQGIVPRNVSRLVDAPGTGAAERPCWTPEQAKRFLRATEGDRLAVLWNLALVSGMRRGELIGATWDDLTETGLHVRRGVSEVRGVLLIGEPKTSRGTRFVPLDPATLKMLKGHKARQAEERLEAGEAWETRPLTLDLIFRDELGGALRPQRVLRAFQRASKAAGVPVTPFHSTRHYVAVSHARHGTPRTVAAEVLGMDVKVLESIYQRHSQPDMAADAVLKIAGTLRDG